MKYKIILFLLLISSASFSMPGGTTVGELLNNSLYIVEFEIIEVRKDKFVVKVLETLKGEKKEKLLINQYSGWACYFRDPYEVGQKGILFIERNPHSQLLQPMGSINEGELEYENGSVRGHNSVNKCTPEQVKSAILEYFRNKEQIELLLKKNKIKTYKTQNPYLQYILKYLALNYNPE